MALLTPVRLIQFRAAYNLPVHAAVKNGIFAKHGLAVEVIYTPGSDFLVAALADGRFEIGHTAADDVVAALAGKVPCDLFLFMGLHSGLLSLVAGAGYGNVQSLRGQLLGVDSASTGFVLLLQKFLRSHGLAIEDYTLVEIGGWEQRCRALLDRRIAATLLTHPYVEDALHSGCRLLARGQDIEPVYQATCGAARRSWAGENQKTLIAYIRAYVEATRWCFEPANRQACLELLGHHMNLDEKRSKATLAALLDSENGLYPDAALNIAGLSSVLALRAETGRLTPPIPSVERYLDLSYYKSAKGIQTDFN